MLLRKYIPGPQVRHKTPPTEAVRFAKCQAPAAAPKHWCRDQSFPALPPHSTASVHAPILVAPLAAQASALLLLSISDGVNAPQPPRCTQLPLYMRKSCSHLWLRKPPGC